MNIYNIARFEGAGKESFTIDGKSVSNHEYSAMWCRAFRRDCLFTTETRTGRFKHGASLHVRIGKEVVV